MADCKKEKKIQQRLKSLTEKAPKSQYEKQKQLIFFKWQRIWVDNSRKNYKWLISILKDFQPPEDQGYTYLTIR